MVRESIISALHTANELLVRKSRNQFKTFVRYSKADYDMQWFHAVICDKLQQFAEGKIKKMMILAPPQHGKSELATRLFPGYLVGRNPDVKIAIASYAQSVASNFNRAIQRNIDNEDYYQVFPNTKLNYSQILKTNYDGYSRTDKKIDIVEATGSITTIGRGGPLTSQPVDIGIIDDLYKDRAEAKSPTISEAAWEWYTDVFKTRMHNSSQQLIMNTRWDELDLAGRLLDIEPGEWEVIIFTGIRTKDDYPYDIREEGEALWPGKHSLKRLLAIKEESEITFNSLYQQQPGGSTKLLIYPEVIEIPLMPDLERFYWGLDLGFTNSKTVLVKCGDDNNGSYFDECCYEAGMPASGVKEILIANGYKRGQVVWTDHKPTFINELRLLDVDAWPAIKGEGSVQAGIIKMHEKPIYITKRSINARREANNYRWVSFAGVVTNEPEKKGYEHFWDAARYGRYSDSFGRK